MITPVYVAHASPYRSSLEARELNALSQGGVRTLPESAFWMHHERLSEVDGHDDGNSLESATLNLAADPLQSAQPLNAPASQQDMAI